MRNRFLLTFSLIVLVVLVVLASAPPVQAQRRGDGRRGPVVVARVAPVYWPGYYYRGFGFDPWFPYGYPVFGYPRQGLYRADMFSSVRFQVTPREALVYVDGYAAGMVDDFDGIFQRLQVIPGRHEILVYLRGYRSIREALYLSPGSTQTIRRTMTPLPAGEADEPEPVPSGAPFEGRGMPPPPDAQPRSASRQGTLALRVQPGDATVLIDGEAWRGPRQDRLLVQLPEGTHQVRVEKSGFQPFSVDVNVRDGETASLNVSLMGQ